MVSKSSSVSHHSELIKDDTDGERVLSEEQLRSKLNEYIHFIDNVLQPELQKAVSKREEIESEIKEYNELKINILAFIRKKKRKRENEKKRENGASDDDTCSIAKISNGEQMALVDLGCELAYCQAKVDNPNVIFVDTGLKGMHVEFTLEEAVTFIDKRMAFLETNVLPKRVEKGKTVAGHLEDSLSLLESLGEEMKSMRQ